MCGATCFWCCDPEPQTAEVSTASSLRAVLVLREEGMGTRAQLKGKGPVSSPWLGKQKHQSDTQDLEAVNSFYFTLVALADSFPTTKRARPCFLVFGVFLGKKY